ncbi:hypothetical protein C7M22_03677 [Bacillus velezensis]|uniref:hypothetical protein n=1 Tax=Bacillus TaxID=1386 RepID=UPI001362A4B7|nr:MULTISPECIES: hypothetical protein [Bacillus]MBR7816751.1 hypothetical protein [Bacillus sp. CCNWLCWHY013]MDH3075754.1 hypothetical protein [Bacillus velezensis]MDH3086648.1 hypothetical protein [Bacillus velezensis]MDH3106981.1 hypothetical protein [Bacillus velezensis]MDH3138642.1 hypothetical protein [Bacillus velezensis]
MNYYKKLSSALHDVENLEEAWDISALINESYQENKITKDEELSLQSDLLSYCGSLGFSLVSIDDYDWEEMKRFNPDLD